MLSFPPYWVADGSNGGGVWVCFIQVQDPQFCSGSSVLQNMPFYLTKRICVSVEN